MKKKKEEDRYCTLSFLMRNSCEKCRLAGKCEEYDKLRAKGKSDKEARAILGDD
jgi:hypothetical protein